MDKRDCKQTGKRIFNMSQLNSHQKATDTWAREWRKEVAAILSLWIRPNFKMSIKYDSKKQTDVA